MALSPAVESGRAPLAFAGPKSTPWAEEAGGRMGLMQGSHMAVADGGSVAEALLAWYDRERRTLAWRAPPGTKQDPYKVWLSEIMLQQTTVKAVTPRYATFLRRWPDVNSLARAVVGEHGGAFPETEAGLRQLPGIGAYTAAAIAAIAFGEPATPVDGNIERVVARLFCVETPLPAAKAEIKAHAGSLTPAMRAGDYAQSLMDLGATICTPRRPACALCPLRPGCCAFAEGLAEVLPYKAEKAERPTRRGAAFVALRADGAVLLRERPLKGLLGGMLETPSTPWEETAPNGNAVSDHAPVEAAWHKTAGLVAHTFTHFHLELAVYRAEIGDDAALTDAAQAERCKWLMRRDLAGAALPSLMRKVLAHALNERR